MTTRISCPFCNSSFAPDAVLPSGRLECPRCGETFAVKSPEGGSEPGSPTPLPAVYPGRSPAEVRAGRRFASLALLVLAVLIIGAGFYLVLFKLRKPTPTPDPEGIAGVVKPLELSGLAYLPGDCNLVLAVQPGPVLEYATRTNQEAKGLLVRAGVPVGVFLFLDKAGVPLAHIDHVLAGTVIGDSEQELRIAIVLVLRGPPADEEQFLEALDARRSPTGNGRYNANLDVGRKLPLALVRVSPTMWVFGWGDADLAPAEHGGGGLSPALRELVAERVPAESAVWLAAGEGNWAEKPLVKALAIEAGKKDWLPQLARGRAAVIGLNFGESPTAHADIQCRDTATATELRDAIRAKVADGATVGGENIWITLTMPFEPRDGLKPFRQFLDVSGK